MSHLIEKHQLKNKGRGRLVFSPNSPSDYWSLYESKKVGDKTLYHFKDNDISKWVDPTDSANFQGVRGYAYYDDEGNPTGRYTRIKGDPQNAPIYLKDVETQHLMDRYNADKIAEAQTEGLEDFVTPWGLLGKGINFSLGKVMEQLPESAQNVIAKGRYLAPSYWIARGSGETDDLIMNGLSTVFGNGTMTMLDTFTAPTIMKYGTKGTPYVAGKYGGNTVLGNWGRGRTFSRIMNESLSDLSNPGELYNTYGPYNTRSLFPYMSKATGRFTESPTIQRIAVNAADDFMESNNSGIFPSNTQLVRQFNPSEIINRPLNLTLKEIADFYENYGDLSVKELMEKGILKPHPSGLHLVMTNGKMRGSFERLFEPNRDKVFSKQLSKPVEKPKEITIVGNDRANQLRKNWEEAEQSILLLKQEHQIPQGITEFDGVRNLSTQQQAEQLMSHQGEIELPITRYYLRQNPAEEKYVERLAEGKEGVPINPETGEPLIITARDINGNPVNSNRSVSLASLLALRRGNNANIATRSLHTRNEPFVETFRGSLPRLDAETLLPNGMTTNNSGKASNGNIIFGTENPLAAANYASTLTSDQYLYVIKQLLKLGIPLSKESIDYGMAVLENILLKLFATGKKIGSLSEEFLRGLSVPRTSSNYGVGSVNGHKLDIKRMPSLFKPEEKVVTSEWNDYINNMYRYNRFFGPNLGYGGLRTLLMRRPNYIRKLDALKKSFDNVNLEYNGKIYTNLMDLEREIGSLPGFKGIDIYDSRNPLLMNTYIAPPESYFYGFGLKKGGKLISKRI